MSDYFGLSSAGFRRTPLAVLNLWHEPRRFCVAVLGVSFATTLILMQLGFFGAVLRSAVLIYERLEFDVAIRSPDYTVLAAPAVIGERRLSSALSVPGVIVAKPLWVGRTSWQNPETKIRRPILVVGIDPWRAPLDSPEIKKWAGRLQQSGNVLFDRRSHRGFGPRSIGIEALAGLESVKIIDQIDLGTGFSADGAIVVGRETFRRICGGRPGTISIGLLKMEPGANVESKVAELRSLLPPDVAVLSRAEVYHSEQFRWAFQESLGIVFLLGLVVSIVAGTAVVYQLLSSEITDRYSEYATLKAMGYRPAYLANLILQQSVILAVSAFPFALFAASIVDRLARNHGGVPVQLWTWRIVTAFALTTTMCCISGILSIRRVQTADPAELF